MADYALAAGGGQVTAHSPLAHGSHAPATHHLTRLAAEALRKLPLLGRLVPRTPVHPKADEVGAPAIYRSSCPVRAPQGKQGGRPCIMP